MWGEGEMYFTLMFWFIIHLLFMMWSIYELIHIWTAVVGKSEEWSWRKFSNLSNWKEEAWKNQSFNGIRTCDLRDTDAMLYELSYEATHWERGQFIEFVSPMRSENYVNYIWITSYLNCGCRWINSYIDELIHIYSHFTPHGRYELNKLT